MKTSSFTKKLILVVIGLCFGMGLIGISAFAKLVVSSSPTESGHFNMVRKYKKDYTTIRYASSYSGDWWMTVGTLKGNTTIEESSGFPFLKGEFRPVTCLVDSKSQKATDGTVTQMKLCARCTSTHDTSGDEIHTLSVRNVGTVQAGGGGKGQMYLLGGRGKYERVLGSCSYTTSYLDDNEVVTTVDCQWERPSPSDFEFFMAHGLKHLGCEIPGDQ